jgi:hypothetical protein
MPRKLAISTGKEVKADLHPALMPIRLLADHTGMSRVPFCASLSLHLLFIYNARSHWLLYARQRLGNLVVICEGLAYKVLKFTNLNCSLEINLWSSLGSVLYLPLMFGI